MFQHSVKVPRLYKTAAKIAKDVKEGNGSIKNLVYEHQRKHPNIKALYALVATLFQRHNEIESLLKRSQFFAKEPRADPWLIKILMVELLWGRNRLPGISRPEKTVLAYEQIFKAHLSDISITPEIDDQGDVKPRYVRVNTLLISLDEAIDGFRNEGWRLCKYVEKTDYKGFLEKITSLAEDEFLIDIHVPNLLIFPPKTKFYNHPAYRDGSIILQDKASCLPVHILNPPPGSIVLDMCAAPGMKTTQLAAALNNEGTIYAVERDPKRFETLSKLVESSGANCVKLENRDVLTCKTEDFPGLEYIIVDPSCSSSGIAGRLEVDQDQIKQRITKLAGFQIKILRSALTWYPNVKKVVYSTCSLFPEENEDVVRQVLETNSKFKLVPAGESVNGIWQNFGSPDYGDIGKYCLYAKPQEDFTNGFFVAVFERLEEDEENQFFNTKIFNYKKHVHSQENRKRRRQEQHSQYDETTHSKVKTKQRVNQDEYRVRKNTPDSINEIESELPIESTVTNLTTRKHKKNKGSIQEINIVDNNVYKKGNNKMEPNNIVEVKGVDTNNSSISNETNVSVARKIKKKKRTEINEALEVNIPKRKNDGKHNHLTNLLVSEVNVSDSPMKKKKKRSDVSHDESEIYEENSVCKEKSISRKKKKLNDLDTNEVPVEITHYETTDLREESLPTKKKTKKRKTNDDSMVLIHTDHTDHASVENSVPKKKKRKHVDADEDVTEENLVPKKKKKQINFNESSTEVSFSEEMSTQKRNKNRTGYEDLVDTSSIVEDKTVTEELGSKRKKGKNKKLSEEFVMDIFENASKITVETKKMKKRLQAS